MISQHDRHVLERFKSLLHERGVSPHSLILFGSRARGDADPESDYDVLVVVERTDREIRTTVSRCAWEAGFDECLLIAPIVVTRNEIEQSPFRSSLLMQAIRDEGVTV